MANTTIQSAPRNLDEAIELVAELADALLEAIDNPLHFYLVPDLLKDYQTAKVWVLAHRQTQDYLDTMRSK